MSRRGFLGTIAAGIIGLAASTTKAQVAVPVPQAPALVIDCHGH